ncbi:uncharacterized protein LOC134531584 [Bacillus rossius redtenbacheri]|uniref:uncharacterized protein LOC134531584 n=1 Tax=Bacillus rossius redtenbacheri TaxID=93214 RepID=UPI002FDD8DBC
MECGSERVVFFTLENDPDLQVACFSPSSSSLHLKELFRAAAEAGPRDVLKLVCWSGQMVDISLSLASNSEHQPYRLAVAAAPTEGMLLSRTEVDLLSLEERVVMLEHQLQAECGPIPPAVEELKSRIDDFRIKLETTEHLSWLGFDKNSVVPLFAETNRDLQCSHKNDAHKQKVRERFFNICCFRNEPSAPEDGQEETSSGRVCCGANYRRPGHLLFGRLRRQRRGLPATDEAEELAPRVTRAASGRLRRGVNDMTVSQEVRQLLRQPSFDCYQWEDEEVLLLLQQMFLDLGFLVTFNISIVVLRNFLFEVYNNYNEIPFHNFRHCFCVAQMMYAIMWCVDLPSKIGDLECLILLTSCICHDLDHPGFNNIYQINARTELALRYNDISPLENHHCSVAFRILEQPQMNILESLHGDAYRHVREGIIRCILATDMARHNEILAQFQDVTPEFDYCNKAHINLLLMVLIKVADISNEARPLNVAEPWLDRLLQEFFKQSDAEKLEGLPITPFMDREKITKPSSQCSFIGFVLLPLFEALGELLTELQVLIVQPVREALDFYRRLNDMARDERGHRKSVVEVCSSGSSDSIAQSASAHSVRSRYSLPALALRSHSTECEQATSVGDLPEELEDEETVTEVEVSEKALKFKISTEGSINSGRKSYPGSRKGSRDKTLVQDGHFHNLAKAMKDKEHRRGDSVKERSRVSPASPVSSQGENEGLLEAHCEDVACMQNDIFNGGTENIKFGDKCFCRVCQSVGQIIVEKHDQAKQIKATDKRELIQQINKTVSCCLDSCKGCADYRSGSLCDQSSENITNSKIQLKSPEDSLNKSGYMLSDIRKAGNNQYEKSSLLSRICNFTDRISFSPSNHSDGDGKSKYSQLLKNTFISSQSLPTTPRRGCKALQVQSSITDESPSTSSPTAISQTHNGSKAMTLPKVKKSQRQNGNLRGWRLFMTGSKSGIPSSSPELLFGKEFHSSLSNGKKHIFRSKEINNIPHTRIYKSLGQSQETGSEIKTEAATREDTMVSGSLDSMLQAKRAFGYAINKGRGSCSSKQSVLLARMGRSESDDSGCTSPQRQAHHLNWMASFTSSLRRKKTREHE